MTRHPSPVLYSFRRCPYAIRARMALQISQVAVEIREVDLKAKPDALRKASPKATVPVLVDRDGRVWDESLDIMIWALEQNDPAAWLKPYQQNPEGPRIVQDNDLFFKPDLDRFKYPERYPDGSPGAARDRGLNVMLGLEQRLREKPYLLSPSLSLVDIAVFPFLRQFAAIDKAWFESLPLPHLKLWLDSIGNSGTFQSVMVKRSVWVPEGG